MEHAAISAYSLSTDKAKKEKKQPLKGTNASI